MAIPTSSYSVHPIHRDATHPFIYSADFVEICHKMRVVSSPSNSFLELDLPVTPKGKFFPPAVEAQLHFRNLTMVKKRKEAGGEGEILDKLMNE